MKVSPSDPVGKPAFRVLNFTRNMPGHGWNGRSFLRSSSKYDLVRGCRPVTLTACSYNGEPVERCKLCCRLFVSCAKYAFRASLAKKTRTFAPTVRNHRRSLRIGVSVVGQTPRTLKFLGVQSVSALMCQRAPTRALILALGGGWTTNLESKSRLTFFLNLQTADVRQ